MCWTHVISGISLIQCFSLSAHIFKAAFPSKFYPVSRKPDSGDWEKQIVTQLVAAYYLKQALKVPSNNTVDYEEVRVKTNRENPSTVTPPPLYRHAN